MGTPPPPPVAPYIPPPCPSYHVRLPRGLGPSAPDDRPLSDKASPPRAGLDAAAVVPSTPAAASTP